MANQYITNKTSYLYESANVGSWSMVLIYGDAVETTGAEVNQRIPVKYRDREGYIKKDHLGPNPVLEVYFIDVGQGDSTFIVTPERKKILIDGGQNMRALGFLSWKYRLDKPGSSVDIDLLVLTHADSDHINGLVPIINHPGITVRHIVHSGIATFEKGAYQIALGDLDVTGKYLITRHSNLLDLGAASLSKEFFEWKDAISKKRIDYKAVDSRDEHLDIGEPKVTIDVIGPRVDIIGGKPAYKKYEDESKTINGHSVVLRLNYDDVSFLFTGDINEKSAKYLMEEPSLTEKMDAHVLKAPHHGSHDFYLPFLEAVKPQVSVISSGDEPDHGHPRALFIGSVGRSSRSEKPLVYSTEIAATFVEIGQTVTLKEYSDLKTEDFNKTEANVKARLLYKQRLNGMINVRTDGHKIYTARRVAAGYWWETYDPLTPASRP
jgi:competence protein ComEC